MEMEDLNDYALLDLLRFCDRDSQLNMMGTSSRFHELIATNRAITNTFRLVITDKFLDDPENCKILESVSRHYGVIILKDLNLQKNENTFHRILSGFQWLLGLQVIRKKRFTSALFQK
jgi:hypothetical protein